MGQQSSQETFSNVQPIGQQETFSDVQPIGQSQPSTWQVLTQPTEKTDAEYKTYRGPAGVAGATIKGLDDVGRGTEGAIEGLYNTFRHPIDTAKNVAKLPSQAAQVPSAIRAINATPDAAYRYADVAQDTVSQGAGQALTALGTAGLGEAAVKAAPYVKPVAGALAKGYAKKLIPSEAVTAYKAVKATRDAPKPVPPEVISPSRTMPGQNPPEVTSVRYGPEEMPPSTTPFGPQQQKLLPAASIEPQTSATPITRGSLSKMMGDQLEKGLGASPPLKPNVPLRGQLSESMKPSTALPEGHTAVEGSSALRSYKYDPQTQEFEAWPTSGDTAYRYGEVSPDSAKAFQVATSKGKAFQQIKNSGTLVAKRVNGKWVSVKPARGSISEQMSK